jgi:hypothetical protein
MSSLPSHEAENGTENLEVPLREDGAVAVAIDLDKSLERLKTFAEVKGGAKPRQVSVGGFKLFRARTIAAL